MVEDDRELLKRWRDGDNRAGNLLFERHFRALLRFFRNKVGTGVEDLIQETFLACVRGRDRIRDEGNFRSYLFSTAKFVFYEHIRRQHRDRVVDVETHTLEDLSPGLSTAFAKRREQKVLLQALRLLPLEVQVTLELYYWEGLSGPELAVALGVPEPAIRSRIRRGSAALRAHVEKLASSPELVASTMDGLQTWLRELEAERGQ